jgi:predicted MFS family arabinose efflux permease
MTVVYFVALNVLAHLSFVGARMTTSLFALKLGATAFTVGLLMALFALLPMLLAVSAGRLIDRDGPRRAMLGALGALAAGAGLPFALPHLATLFVSSTLIGTAFMYMHVSMNSVIGALGRPESRPVNFSWLALGFSTSGSFGPLIAGYAIDSFGHARAFGLLAFFPLLGFALLWMRRTPLPRPEHAHAQGATGRVLDLLKPPGLRRTFAVSGLLAMGWDLYAFLMPVYGARLGLAAATIGIIMATFAGATFAVRLAMPLIVRRLRDWQIITAALAVSGASYLLFPLVTRVPLLMGLSFTLGIGLGCAQPMIMALLFNTAPRGRQGEVVGVRTFMLNASHTLIPLVSGASSALLGLAPVFWALALCLLAGSWFIRGRAPRA